MIGGCCLQSDILCIQQWC